MTITLRDYTNTNYIDDVWMCTDYINYPLIYTEKHCLQTITATSTYKPIYLKVYSSKDPDTIDYPCVSYSILNSSLAPVSDGLVGIDYFSGYFSWVTLPFQTWYLPYDGYIRQGQSYYIYIHILASAGNYGAIRLGKRAYDSYPAYTTGTLYQGTITDQSPLTWSAFPSFDLMFELWGMDIVTGTIATKSMSLSRQTSTGAICPPKFGGVMSNNNRSHKLFINGTNIILPNQSRTLTLRNN